LEGFKVPPAKILIFLVDEMAFLRPISVKSALYKQYFASRKHF
jgi:hypothetical protein